MSEAIGRYRILARLGPGRLGVVYRALDPQKQKPAALRLIRMPAPGEGPGDARQGDLLRAVRAAATLDHPNIAAVFDHGESDVTAEPGSSGGRARVLYIASALVEGQSLASRLAAGASIEPDRACRWLTQVLLALEHAHSRGVVHGDLKPANVFITAAEEIRLTDFGLSGADRPSSSGDVSTFDSPAFLAPEQLLGDPIDPRTDLFAAGVLLYQMLVGRPPYLGAAAEVIEQKLARDAPLPSQVQPSLGTAFDDVVSRALARRPEQRLASANQFLMALNRAVFKRAAPAGAAASTPSMDARSAPAVTPQTAPADAWKAQAAAPLEAALADAIGPFARVLVRKALDKATTFEAVLEDLAGQIPEPKQQQAFLAVAGRARPQRVAHPAPEQADTQASSRRTGASPPPPSGGVVDQATLQLAAASLSDAIGPMARVIVSRAAAEAGSRTEFFLLLAKSIQAPMERKEFLRQFGVSD